MTSELHTPSTLADLIVKELMGVDPDSQCVELDDTDWKLIVAALRRATPSADTVTPSSGCVFKDLGIEKPSADALAGLLRYKFEVSSEGHPFMGICNDGKYVLHSEAAAVVAAKEAENSGLKSLLHENGTPRFNAACRRAEAAEAKNKELEAELSLAVSDEDKGAWRWWSKKARELTYENTRLKTELAKLKAQEPVAWMHPEARWTDVSKQEVAVHCKIRTYPLPLYASPVSDSLKAENERLRKLVTDFSKQHLTAEMKPEDIFSADFEGAYDVFITKSRAALNVEASND